MSDAGLHKQRRSPRHGADGLNIVVTAVVIIITTSLLISVKHFSVLVRMT